MSKRRVFLVDDHPIVRAGLRILIDSEPDLEVCGDADRGDTASARILEANPDLIVVDIALRTTSGLELVRCLRTAGVRAPVLVLSMHDEALYVTRVIQAGAQAFLPKGVQPERILLAIRELLRGRTFMAESLNRALELSRESTNDQMGRLSERELEVFSLIGRGYGTRQIAEFLSVGMKTVESYRSRIKQKLCVADGSMLTRRAVQWAEKNAF